MYFILIVIAWLAIAYLLGSLPWSVWIGKVFFGVDVRQHGSGNAGATNTFRVLGRKAGIMVLALDVAKGTAAVELGSLLPLCSCIEAGSLSDDLRPVAGAAAILGHVYSAFLRFKGGKGVATALGVMLSLAPWATLASAGVFGLTWLLTGYISLGSLSAATTFPLFHAFLYKVAPVTQWVLVGCTALFIFYTHRSNIRRLLEGKENKMPLFQKVDREKNKNLQV